MSIIEKEVIMEEVRSFPTMSETATKLLALLDNPESNASQMEEVLRYDPGLTANILKLTNSAYFGLPHAVGSVRQAVVLLGLKRIKQLVMASCVNAIMDKPVPGYDLSPGKLWQHSIAVSFAAEELVKELNIPAAQEIFTAALLHDLGKMVLGHHVRDEIASIESTTPRDLPFTSAERAVLGTDHAEIGARILERWALPIEVVEAVRWHHEPDKAKRPNALIDTVHVANMLCLMMGIGVGREGLSYEPSPEATRRLNLKTEHLEIVASRTLEWINELSDDFEYLNRKEV